MITIKQAVKQALAHMPGNTWFEASQVEHIAHEKGTHFNVPDHKTHPNGPWLSNAQIARALQDMSHVESNGKGKYRVRGRKV